jgi:hypothetical protein
MVKIFPLGKFFPKIFRKNRLRLIFSENFKKNRVFTRFLAKNLRKFLLFAEIFWKFYKKNRLTPIFLKNFRKKSRFSRDFFVIFIIFWLIFSQKMRKKSQKCAILAHFLVIFFRKIGPFGPIFG